MPGNLGGKKEERSDAGAKLEKQSGLDNAHRECWRKG